MYVLRTGCQWKALPKERFGSASAVHKRFLEWEEAGFFETLWKAGLAEYDEMEGIAWRWQSVDGAMMKAPLAQEAVGPNPTDRGKKRKQTPPAGGRPWRPVVAHRDRGQREVSGWARHLDVAAAAYVRSAVANGAAAVPRCGCSGGSEAASAHP